MLIKSSCSVAHDIVENPEGTICAIMIATYRRDKGEKMGHSLEKSKKNTERPGQHDLHNFWGREESGRFFLFVYHRKQVVKWHFVSLQKQITKWPAWIHTYSSTFIWEGNKGISYYDPNIYHVNYLWLDTAPLHWRKFFSVPLNKVSEHMLSEFWSCYFTEHHLWECFSSWSCSWVWIQSWTFCMRT